MPVKSKFDDPVLIKEVLRRDALREKHRALALPDNQVSIAKELGVPQSAVHELISGRTTRQIPESRREEIVRRYNNCLYHTAIARAHNAPNLCRELGISTRLRVRILRENKPDRQPVKPWGNKSSAVHRFLTGALA